MAAKHQQDSYISFTWPRCNVIDSEVSILYLRSFPCVARKSHLCLSADELECKL